MIKAIYGTNFSGKSHYLKCFTKYPSKEVLYTIGNDKKLERDSRLSIYVGGIPEYSFTGIFDTVYNELFRLKPEQEISPFIFNIIRETGFDNLYNQNPFTLSGGEKALLAILSAAIMNPKALAIDSTLEQIDNFNKEALLKGLSELSIPAIILSDNRLSEINKKLYKRQSYTPLKEPLLETFSLPEINAKAFQVNKRNSPHRFIIKNLSFSYNKKIVFKDFSLDIKSGHIIRLFGKNGSGKSTLAKILSGVLKADRNSTFTFNNERVNLYKTPGNLVGYCFQQPDEQLFGSTVLSELALASSSDLKDSVIKAFGLESILDEHPYDLPMTMRKRLSIAATLISDRPIYIIDEPTLYLDDKNIDELSKIFVKLTTHGKTIIIISHSDSFISKFSNLLTIKL